MSQTITFYPIGNAETCLLELGNGKKILFDYAQMRSDATDDTFTNNTTNLSIKIISKSRNLFNR